MSAFSLMQSAPGPEAVINGRRCLDRFFTELKSRL
jgi:hypothetical protein